ncbi:acyl-dehydrogenase [Ceraceosorus bombacis]|uniref:Acyl-dehydrogenase n=1 Tax=Ceraceosorus bombacis TaxID=401625 RepID=A0A0P1B911_9BASI|nr:acyl-dehydrogenase [Ceraceosorus bombacis]
MASPHAKLLTRSKTPFAEAPWQQGLPSPYYKETHYRFREWLKKWVDDNLMELADEWEEIEDDAELAKVFQLFAKEGFLLPFALGVRVPQKFVDMAGGQKLPGGVPPGEWDNFHDFILIDELARTASNGVVMGNYGGLAYGAGPIVHFASEGLQKRLLPDILTGKKRISLAITEPSAGSDVAGVSTVAKLSDDGKHYVVTGLKKITNGIWSDFFTTAVRTSGKPGDQKGISFLVIPRSEGVRTTKMKMQSAGSGTTFVEFDEVKVPAENLIGKEGEAFKYIMWNFLHERETIIYVALRFCRVFGKKLIEQPVVRYNLANMARQTEALQAWMEAIVYQHSKMTTNQANILLGGNTALLKAHAAIVVSDIAREAGYLMGGTGLTKGGIAARIERIYREVNGLATPGGSVAVMLDAGVRQAIKTVGLDPSKL